eukprot:TRINITY_DN12612_c0_g1_i2.p1 TRINITY_DN12612_c0_g1~~TRINITY_DN12612_c0_g1_i2.p1  ORF type:complete len:680 (+),score=217.13 TRINITY_DN12612_c0_g1_i2:78-2042(+)
MAVPPPPSPDDCLELMVPGRVCLLGEHSDWAGGFRRFNSALTPGYCLVCGTEEGIFARVSKHPSKLVVYARTDDGKYREPFVCQMEQKALLKVAQEGGFYSYVAGVAFQLLIRNQIGGLVVDNYRTTLPVKKGLSSSAAVCVLIARAFNRVYDLRMTLRGEMELAYQGEITTPSRCGKMDQCCAFGQVPVQMTFDGDACDCEEVILRNPFYFVIVDLCASKDTMTILSQLSRGFPKATNEVERGVQEFLGPINEKLMRKARAALESGDARGLGEIYTEFQALFDEKLIPACPSELTAPVLHKALRYEPLQKHIWGCKGVGSQGDGTAQFLCKSEADREAVIRIIEADLGMSCLRVTLGKKRRVRRALIPCAGYSVDMYPATKVAKSPLLPVRDHDGYYKPAILMIVQEALSAGVDQVILVVQSHDMEDFARLFHEEIPIANLNQLSTAQQKLGKSVVLVPQMEQRGLADAVFCARQAVGDEPFLLCLGDHLYTSRQPGVSCGRQVADRFSGQSVISLRETPEEQIHKYGAVTGVWRADSEHQRTKVMDIQSIAEKPTREHAREHLRVDGMADGRYLTFFGLSVLTARVFEILQRDPSVHFTKVLDELRREQGVSGIVVSGERFDIGDPEAYLQTTRTFGAARQLEHAGSPLSRI